MVLRDGTVKSIALEMAVDIIEQYLDDLCLDCETSGYWVGHDYYELRTVQLGGEEMAVVLDAADPKSQAVVRWALAAAVRLWAHSAPADAIPCVVAGFISWDDIWAKMYDSVIRAKLTDPKLCGSEADKLKDLARDLGREYAVSPKAEEAKNALFKVMKCLAKTDVTTPRERNGWHQVSKFAVTMIRYAGSDVLDLAMVLRLLPPLPVPQSVMERERETEAICARAAYQGFPLDLSHIGTKISEHEHSQADAKEAVEELSGGRLKNPSASKEVLEYLLEQNYPLKLDRKTKMPTAGKESLTPIAKRGDKLAQNIVDYRHDVTTLGLLLRPLENLCTHGDSIMRPMVYTINAKTGRMSCVRPNGQQFSRQGGIRACVRCWLAYRGISVDFSGCEIIVGAALSGDQSLYDSETSAMCWRCEQDPCTCGKNHTGLHWRVAHAAFGYDAAKEDRYNCKRGTFTRLFGGGPATAADQVGCDISIMHQVWEAFAKIAPLFTLWDQWMRDCYDEGMLVWRDYDSPREPFDQDVYTAVAAASGNFAAMTYFQSTLGNYAQKIPGGGRHMVYQTYSGRNVYVTNGAHAAGNGAIQGTARELLVDGLLLWQYTPWGYLPVLPVHDQLISMVPEQDAGEASATLARCMETDVLSSPGFPVHVGVDTDAPFVSWPDSS